MGGHTVARIVRCEAPVLAAGRGVWHARGRVVAADWVGAGALGRRAGYDGAQCVYAFENVRGWGRGGAASATG